MPIAQIFLVRNCFADDAICAMILEASAFYARTLYPDTVPPPIERIRVFASLVEPQHWAAGGLLASNGGESAPYFTCVAMAGRLVEQRQALLAGITEIIARHLHCDARQIRSQILTVEPDNWGIGGKSASIARKAEVEARAAQHGSR